MTVIAKEIFNQAIKLTPIERAELIESLLSSFNTPKTTEYEQEWNNEIEDRWELFEKGKMKTKNSDKVFAEINQKYEN